jgi:tRNA(adenine34) deaminase
VIWDELSSAWKACFTQAWLAYRAGSVPIGACITDQAGTMLAWGHNRIEQTDLEIPYLHNSRLAHAEMNAILHLISRKQNEPQYAPLEPRDLILYTTTEPCPLCVWALVMMNFKELKYASKEAWGGSLEILEANHYLRAKNIKVHHPENTLLETILVMLHVEFELRVDKGRSHELIHRWAQDTPQAVQLGTALHQNGKLSQLRHELSEARDAFNTLERLMMVV